MSTMIQTPSTPQASRTKSPAVATPTGTWRHPRMDEINHRVRKNTFNERNVHRIIWNSFSLLASILTPKLLDAYLPSIADLAIPFSPFSFYVLLVVQLLFVFNIACAFLPLLRKPDDLADIPLTPSQRSLLGLPATKESYTPGSQYITPPRYAKSSTPRSISGSGSRPGSPASGTARAPSNGPESPLAAAARSSASQMTPSGSPLFRKATEHSRRQSTDLNFLSKSTVLALESSAMSSLSSGPGSPTPAGYGKEKGPSVHLTNKWLYERGGSSPGKRSLFT